MKFTAPELVSHPRPPRIILLPLLGSLDASEAKGLLADLFEADYYSPLACALAASTGTETISESCKKRLLDRLPNRSASSFCFSFGPFRSVFPFLQSLSPLFPLEQYPPLRVRSENTVRLGFRIGSLLFSGRVYPRGPSCIIHYHTVPSRLSDQFCGVSYGPYCVLSPI